jgi:8-oxo-dGTP pyrophosphatase MutT (NUDIX family)
MNDIFRTASSKITPAATVILTRERAGTLQVYLLKRHLKSGFMAGNYVFPGGTVSDSDQHFNVFKKHCDLTPAEIAHRFGQGLTAEQALSFCVAAVRETLEEAGVFLACRNPDSAADLNEVNRLRLEDNPEDSWFCRLFENSQWRLSLSALFGWSHWITPERMKHRFDTRFFMAQMPPGQRCQPDGRETVRGLWLSPGQALAGNMAGDVPLSPPTLVSLHELTKYPDLGSLKIEAARRQWGRSIQPRLVPLPQGAVIVEPWDPMYRQPEIDINPGNLPSSVLPIGAPFSRIWLDRGIWKPVGI